MTYSYRQLEDLLTKDIRRVFKVFSDFFGPDYVDLHLDLFTVELKCITDDFKESGKDSYDLTQADLAGLPSKMGNCACILVWWPSVKVTNEHNRSIFIKDLYAQISVNVYGCIRGSFLLNRATYPLDQWVSGYMHSHISGIPKDDISKFKIPCLGSGPIKNTCETLRQSNDSTEWMLFCQELSLYVTVESLKGIPYRHLEQVHNGGNVIKPDTFFGSAYGAQKIIKLINEKAEYFTFDDFVKYYLKHNNLKFSFANGEYVLGITLYDYLIDISNAFINLANNFCPCPKRLLGNRSSYFNDESVVHPYVTDGKVFYTTDAHALTLSSRSIMGYQGLYILTFKGKDIKLAITESNAGTLSIVNILDIYLSLYVLQSILKIINLHYQNDNISNNAEQAGDSATTGQKVFYL